MGEVIFIRHQGFRCALPAQQVTGATVSTDGETLQLFTTHASSKRVARCLTVATAEGIRPLPCEDARFGTIEEAKILPLSDLLIADLGMPHLVGAVDENDDVIWLIDLTQWRSKP